MLLDEAVIYATMIRAIAWFFMLGISAAFIRHLRS